MVRIVEDAEKSGFPSIEDRERYRQEIISRLIKRIEERLNKSNVAELQQLVSKEFQSDLELYHRYQGYLSKTIPFDTTRYRDIVSYQDGTVLKSLNLNLFGPIHNFHMLCIIDTILPLAPLLISKHCPYILLLFPKNAKDISLSLGVPMGS